MKVMEASSISVKDANYYLSLPYTYEVIQEDATTWFARVKELPGCITEADSAEEAIIMIRDAQIEWIDAALESGYPIAEPLPEVEYSGKLSVRLPRSLHQEVSQIAAHDGVSLNQYINITLAKAAANARS